MGEWQTSPWAALGRLQVLMMAITALALCLRRVRPCPKDALLGVLLGVRPPPVVALPRPWRVVWCWMLPRGGGGPRAASSLAQSLSCVGDRILSAPGKDITNRLFDWRATDVDVHSWMSHQKQLDDRQRPSATIGNSHRQRPCRGMPGRGSEVLSSASLHWMKRGGVSSFPRSAE